MTRAWWKATALNSIAALLGVLASFLTLSICASFVVLDWRWATDDQLGRAIFVLASAFWIKQAALDGPIKVEK